MNTNKDKLSQLRLRAEVALKHAVDVTMPTNLGVDELTHELNVYHAELEIQLEDLQHSYQALEAAQLRYASLFDFAPVGYIVTDRLGVVITANQTASSMLGVDRTILEKKAFIEFITTEFQDTYHLSRRSVLQTHRLQTAVVQLQRADGTVFHAQLDTDFPDPQGETLRTAITNISTIKQTEEALLRALAHEKEINDLRSRVLSVIGHEFRTPLTIILSAIETLDHYGDRLTTEARNKRFETIRNLVWYLNNTVEDAHDISSGDNHDSLKQETFDILAFVRQITHAMGIMAKAGQTIVLDVSAAHDIEWVTWDQHLTRRIVMNLLNNALKYSQGSVVCSLYCEDSVVRLSVADSGIGISEQDQNHIYEAFYRGQNTESTSGIGIGLFIVYRAVKAHGGTIRCESSLGKGTTFIVELPRQAPTTPAA
jgi:PAS domain S-box-containing protein